MPDQMLSIFCFGSVVGKLMERDLTDLTSGAASTYVTWSLSAFVNVALDGTFVPGVMFSDESRTVSEGVFRRDVIFCGNHALGNVRPRIRRHADLHCDSCRETDQT
jgi:hypothetical protein